MAEANSCCEHKGTAEETEAEPEPDEPKDGPRKAKSNNLVRAVLGRLRSAAGAKNQPSRITSTDGQVTAPPADESDGTRNAGEEPARAARGGGLTGMSGVQGIFHFMDGPADVLRASVACRRWRELACADSVWRVKFEREGMEEKARVFEVALPGAAGGEGGSSVGAAAEEDTAAGVGLAFYAQVFALKGYQMQEEDYQAFQFNHVREHGGIRTAVATWCEDPAAAKAMYGPIASWDTSGITDIYGLFSKRHDFNEDISRWDVSNVVDCRNCFEDASSFAGDISQWRLGKVTDMYRLFIMQNRSTATSRAGRSRRSRT